MLDTSNSQAVQVTEGVGVNSTNVPAGDEQAIAGDNPDELIQFTFSDDVDKPLPRRDVSLDAPAGS